MFIPGPRRQSIRLRRSSRPSQAKSSSLSSSLKLQARQVPFGREKAWVPQSMRIPLGPSEQPPTGMPKPFSASVTPPKAPAIPGVTLGEHMPSPRTMAQRSASRSWERNSGIVLRPSATSRSFQP